jgi:hypothetical protein
MRIPLILLSAVSAVGLSGCAYGDGFGYGPYGGSSVSIGVGYGGGYGGYGYGYPYGGYGGYGGYYGGYDPFGWYGDYYYPGTGVYVYDRYRNRHVWNDGQRRYWQDRSSRWQSTRGTNSAVTSRENWSRWDRNRQPTVRDPRGRRN